MSKASFWTEDRIEVLAQLWLHGYSAGEISKHLPCSRNAVMGKVYRLGLMHKGGTLSGPLPDGLLEKAA